MVAAKPDPDSAVTQRSIQSRRCATVVILLIGLLLLALVSRVLWWTTTRHYVPKNSNERMRSSPSPNYYNKRRRAETTNTIILVPVDSNLTSTLIKPDGSLNQTLFHPLTTIRPHQKATPVLVQPTVVTKKKTAKQDSWGPSNSTLGHSSHTSSTSDDAYKPTHTSNAPNNTNSVPMFTLPNNSVH
ncbi:hypothetical protein K493DRAFT_295656 [Basidiobolus meristosporus CBS 931.73]|uniref:Uncharacterized protein n=1 Tax=Basidiobolus meristosporus CBS 931.73 TaxID=1314790 RepID=A0A1Y1ZA03_9FUNG|nr:hypothetical protein K493DRAFT_295656 [Basidiobolus meristosporus CBS 931.73]|eukprot:ORY07081.1 hypothetical protein K493DRAFT_295656 [Basidiobolus meristosporus CBS 931.73]